MFPKVHTVLRFVKEERSGPAVQQNLENGNRIGLWYRSSQPKTDGIGDHTEYFQGHGGHIDPKRLYLCRFTEPEVEDEDEGTKRGANR